MPRIPAADIERLKETISVARLAEARGVTLTLVITPAHWRRIDATCARGLIPFSPFPGFL